MKKADRRYNRAGSDQPGLELGPDSLAVWQGHARQEFVWADVTAVRWRGYKEADIEIAGGEVVSLPAVDDVESAVVEIGQRAAAARPKWPKKRGPRHLPDVGRAFVRQRSAVRLRQAIGKSLAASGCVAVLLCAGGVLLTRGRDLAAMLHAAVLLFVVTLVYAIGYWLVESRRITTNGLLVRHKRLPWSELISIVDVHRDHLPKGPDNYWVKLETKHGRATFLAHEEVTVELIREYLAERERWTDAPFTAAGPMPPPDNALSLARETGHDATERGLSRTVGDGGDR